MRDGKRTEASKEHDRWLRRQAVQIVAQLPESEEEALKILAHARELVSRFIGDDVGRWESRALRLVSNFENGEAS
ncbi:hypothetical protein [Aureimonas pseudogalii]|uniref:Uncharacterized protein n=1 Tax=Aureimonas pseudogalii TaxID=1744844 RepID=A0A7W6H2C2_9HYPH|nr:hypothetical protein [Aureimonas pseudogalii]MBB3996901.1 hypothetical protein [Aureimonas pseudogalii]